MQPYTETKLPFIAGEPKVFVCLGRQFGLITRMFAQIGFSKAETPEEADLVVFGGGSDVSPSYYGQEPIPECGQPNPERDAYEKGVFEQCVANNIPMFGICRGAQFLHVMCGGELWQDVDNHCQTHEMLDVMSNMTVRTSSTHHQMMKFNGDMTLLAYTLQVQARNYADDKTRINLSRGDLSGPIEVEVCCYPDQRVLCCQGHPEYGPAEFASWANHMMLDWFRNTSVTFKEPETTS